MIEAAPTFIIDANILIYAFRRETADHATCATWLNETLSEGQLVAAPNIVEIALLRILTFASLREAAAPIEAIFGFLTALRSAGYRRLESTPETDKHLERLCNTLGLRGNDINDAFLAALAFEHGATLVSADKGFGRFPGLRWLNPLEP